MEYLLNFGLQYTVNWPLHNKSPLITRVRADRFPPEVESTVLFMSTLILAYEVSKDTQTNPRVNKYLINTVN